MEALRLAYHLKVLTESSAILQETACEVEPLVETMTDLCKSFQDQKLDVPSEKLLRMCLDSAMGLGKSLEQKLIEVNNGWHYYESSVQKFIDNKVSGEREFEEVTYCLNEAIKNCESFVDIMTLFRNKLTDVGNLAKDVMDELEKKKENTDRDKSKAESAKAAAGAVSVGGVVTAGALAALCLFSGGLAVPVVAAGVAGATGAAAGVGGAAVWANKRKEVAKFDQLLKDFKDQLENMKQLSSSINDMKGSAADISKVPNEINDSLRAALNHLSESRQKEEEIERLRRRCDVM